MSKINLVRAVALALLVARGASAQTFPLAIHEHPQKAFYASADEFKSVCFDPQAHWIPGNAVIPIPEGEAVITTHVAHIKFCGPAYAVFNQPIPISFTIMAFQLDGRVADFFAGVLQGRPARDVVWDDTGSDRMPVMTGDPHGLKTWSGHFMVDPDPAYPHGWIEITGSSAVLLTNGDSTRANGLFPLFSALDTSKPEEYGFPMVASRPTPASPRRPDVRFGALQLDIQSYLPLAPFSMPWVLQLSPIRYGSPSELPLPVLEVRTDVDLHHGNPGRLLTRIVDPPNPTSVTLNPPDIGPGPHNIVIFFVQPDGGLEQASSIVRFDVVIGPDVPVPPPPPPPVPVDPWVTVATLGPGVVLQRNSTEHKLRVCEGLQCLAWVVQ